VIQRVPYTVTGINHLRRISSYFPLGQQLPISLLAVGSAKSSTHGYCYWAPSALWHASPKGANF